MQANYFVRVADLLQYEKSSDNLSVPLSLQSWMKNREREHTHTNTHTDMHINKLLSLHQYMVTPVASQHEHWHYHDTGISNLDTIP